MDGNMDIQHEAAVGIRFRRSAEKILALTVFLLAAGLSAFDHDMVGATYDFYRVFAPAEFWILYFTMLGTARIAFLTVNGHYPFGAQVRAFLSFVTLFSVWTPLTAAYFWNVMQVATGETVQQFFPGAALAPACVMFEGLSFFALATLWRTKRDARRRDREGDRSGPRVPVGDRGGLARQPEEQASLATA